MSAQRLVCLRHDAAILHLKMTHRVMMHHVKKNRDDTPAAEPPRCRAHLVLNSGLRRLVFGAWRAHERWLKQHCRRESAGEG